MIPEDVVDDLCSRFIINIPQEERSDLTRVCFHIELAHWFYIDYYCSEQKDLPKCQFKEFARIIFMNVPFLEQHVIKIDSVIDKWREYKMAVPTYGAILLDEEMDNVLLVQGFWARSSWGFPKGKVNADEDPLVCACREVLEETGYDCRSAISAKDYIELHIQDTLIRLYIVTGVDKKTTFKPMTRCEIKSCNWFKISDLPMTRRDMVTIQSKNVKPNAFFMTIPFIKPLRKWINRRKRRLSEKGANFSQDFEFGDQDISNISNFTVTSTPKQNNRKKNQNITSILQRPQSKQKTKLSDQFCSFESSNNASESGSDGRKFWSQTWANLRIDWNKILCDVKL